LWGGFFIAYEGLFIAYGGFFIAYGGFSNAYGGYFRRVRYSSAVVVAYVVVAIGV
jgi:hypothetical protein